MADVLCETWSSPLLHMVLGLSTRCSQEAVSRGICLMGEGHEVNGKRYKGDEG